MTEEKEPRSPPARPAGAASHTLPPRPRPIIGRERELALARRRLLAPDIRLLTLVGPPGVGKTRLAIELATAVADPSARSGAVAGDVSERPFSDGAWFVDLAPIADPRLVADAIARGLGLDADGRAPADVLEEYLRDRALLLVLDNFEQVLGAADLVGRLLAACPRLKVVTTSRAPLHLRWEHELPVPPLDLPDPNGPRTMAALAASPAVQLFVERARAVAPDFQLAAPEAGAVAEICRHLDGLPLAIELAAARIKLFSPVALMRRLTGADEAGRADVSPLHLLAGRVRDVPARQQTLWGAITWSYDVLDANEQRLFRRLAVFVGGCSLDAADDVGAMETGAREAGAREAGAREAGAMNCAPTGSGPVGAQFIAPVSSSSLALPPSPLDLVDSLVDKSLVIWVEQADGEPRLGLLETLREFGLEQLRAGGELEAVQRHHAEYFLALAEQAGPELSGPDQVRWLNRLEPERANLLRVLEWSVERGETEIGLRLGASLWPFWLVRGHARGARARLIELVAVGRGGPPNRARAAALVGAAILSRHVGDYTTARALLRESLDIGRALEDQPGIALALHHLAWLTYLEGDLAESWALSDQSLQLFRSLGDTAFIAQVLHSQGFVAHLRGDYPMARARYEEGLVLHRQVGNRRGEALALHNLGLADALLKGDSAAARKQYGEALQIFRELGDRRSIAMALGNLGDVALMQHDYAAAQALHHECLVAASEADDRRRVAFSMAGVAVLAAARGEAAAALRLAAAATALRETIGAAADRGWQARLEPWLAAARAKLGRQAAAQAWAEGAAMTPGQALGYALAGTASEQERAARPIR